MMWLSFADPDLPAGQQLLGVAIVHADDLIAAIEHCHRLGINPGGDVMAQTLDLSKLAALSFELPVDRLLSPEEAKELRRRIREEVTS